ncbi:MAG: SPOR domain-containing protein [Proteobacteria bacterium]|nr:SPOR domain-containing protein [Pseudomonadota bacterium]
MLGRIVLLLCLANAGWWAWSQGWLQPVGLVPARQAEPERLARQVNPQALNLRPVAPDAPDALAAPAPAAVASEPAGAAAPVAAAEPPPAAGVCLQAGLFDDQQIEAVRRAAADLPEGSWRVEPVQLPGRWMVYIGKLADANAVATKRAEVRALGVDTDRPGAGLEPGLSLGRFSTEEAAQRALGDVGRKGVRTARVVQERRESPGYLLRLPAADEGLRQQLPRLREALAGRDIRPCE